MSLKEALKTTGLFIRQLDVESDQPHGYTSGPFVFFHRGDLGGMHLFGSSVDGYSASLDALWNIARRSEVLSKKGVEIFREPFWKPAMSFRHDIQSHSHKGLNT